MAARYFAKPSAVTCATKNIVCRALLGALTWVQLRRWQTCPAATAGASSPADKRDAAGEPDDIQATAQGIVDAAEDEAQQG